MFDPCWEDSYHAEVCDPRSHCCQPTELEPLFCSWGDPPLAASSDKQREVVGSIGDADGKGLDINCPKKSESLGSCAVGSSSELYHCTCGIWVSYWLQHQCISRGFTLQCQVGTCGQKNSGVLAKSLWWVPGMRGAVRNVGPFCLCWISLARNWENVPRTWRSVILQSKNKSPCMMVTSIRYMWFKNTIYSQLAKRSGWCQVCFASWGQWHHGNARNNSATGWSGFYLDLCKRIGKIQQPGALII